MEPSRIQNILFFTALVLVTLLFLYLLKPFFFPVFWAVVMAGIFKPLFRRLNTKLNRPAVSSSIVLMAVIFIIILPGAVIGSLLFSESMQIYNSLGAADSAGIEKKIAGIAGVIKNNPHLAKLHINETVLTDKFAEIARSISNYIFVSLKDLTQNTILFIVQFVVMLYTLFFFVRDGDKFLEMTMKFFSFGQDRERILYERFVATARATLKVTLIIGGLQGFLGCLLFWFTGIEGALVWGVVMVIMAIVPVVGCSIIWAPAGMIMLLTGHIWEGVVILAVGVLVISMVDNFLRPILLGRDVQLHPLLIFLSTLGGISLFGFSGFVIGPIITSLLLAILTMYDQFYRGTLS
jgi:predicted PurR-regulated permease PerM